MKLSIDHIFICTARGAPEAEHLKAFGLEEGSPNRHLGQGTACRRYFFHNAMLELLWIENESEAKNQTTRPTRLWERWSNRQVGASPFGICFRPAQSDQSAPTFPYWNYHPAYLPPTLAIKIATKTPLTEPMWFYLGFSKRPDALPTEQRQPLNHAAGLRELTRVSLTIGVSHHISPTATLFEQAGLLSTAFGSQAKLELGFDGEVTKQQRDFRPLLPVVFRW